MDFCFSDFGNKFSSKSGIGDLMDDMGRALSGKEKVIMMGGGNPAHISEIDNLWRSRMSEILQSGREFEKAVGDYDPPQGNLEFIDAVVQYFNGEYGWDIRRENVAVTNGSQNAFFYLFNLFAGKCAGKQKKILFPLCPEYIGYTDQGLCDDMFVSRKPKIEILEDHIFKYRVDFDSINITDDIAAICVSRPTNPTGNVITDEEIRKLSDISEKNNIPLIIDNAYGAPFPYILFQDVELVWKKNIVLSMSLSKTGLPSVRTGFIIADEKIASAVSAVNAVISLANSRIGQAITAPLIKNGQLADMSRKIIRPYYKEKSERAVERLLKYFSGNNNFFIHKSEGSIFLWLWFKEMPIMCADLYERIKRRNIIIVPGHFFYPGLSEDWRHRHECIRMNYSQNEEDVFRGIEIIAEEVNRAYGI